MHAGSPDRPLTVLRDADRLRLEHFELGTRHRSLERVSVLVDDTSARELTRDAFDETIRYLKGGGDWVENLEVAFRMLRIGIRVGDTDDVRELLSYMDTLWGSTEQIRGTVGRLYHQGREVRRAAAYTCLRNYLHARRIEAVCSAVRGSMTSEVAREMFGRGVVDRTGMMGRRAFGRRAALLAAADLRVFDREDDGFGGTSYDGVPGDGEVGGEDEELAQRLSVIREFLDVCEEDGDDVWRMTAARAFLCTRPPSYFDVGAPNACQDGRCA